MANPTTNYSFAMPTNTDLVKDLPADFEVFGQAVDTQMKTNADAAIAKTIVDAKGDIIAATAADTVARLASSGVNNDVLTVDTSTATGLKWAAVAGGGWTSIASGSLSSTSVALTSIPTTYYELVLFIDNPYVNSSDRMRLRCNGDSSTVYSSTWIYTDTSAWSNASGKTGVDFWVNNTQNNGTALPTSSSSWGAVVRIPNYASTATYKTIYLQGWSGTAFWGGGAGGMGLSHYEGATSAITSLTITTENGTATFSGGTYALYGLK